MTALIEVRETEVRETRPVLDQGGNRHLLPPAAGGRAAAPVSTTTAPAMLQPASGTRPAPRQFELGELMSGAQEIMILHNGRNYRLRITRQGKLLLTA